MEHSELVAEMPHVERLGTQERLQLARRRRLQQLKVWSQRDKEWTRSHKNQKDRSRRIYFSNAVMLLEAASRNDVEEVKRLLMSGVDPDSTNEDGLTALHQCCIDDNEEMLQLLLDFGANPNAEDSEKWTPLHAAATCAHLHLIRYLINKGANLLAVNADGNMPYDICEDEAALDYIEGEMARRGVTQQLIDETRAATEMNMLRDLQESNRQGNDLEAVDNQGATALHIAAANGYIRVVEYLLDQNVSVDPRDSDGWQPVHAAACWGHLEVVEMLVQAGADLNARTRYEETPADICEDAELRERILALLSEQENRKQDQRRKVRRSQSNNTRTQSVRRTSIRDKSLTTKKDAVEEARLRLTLTPDMNVPITPKSGSNAIEAACTTLTEPPQTAQERLEPDGKDKEDPVETYSPDHGALVVPTEASYVTADNANGKININVTVTISTLADLKKQRAQNRGMADGGTELSPRSSIASDRSPEGGLNSSPPVHRFSGPTADPVPDVRTRSCCTIV